MLQPQAWFIGHGSPMNALESNSYTQAWANLTKTIKKPKTIIMVSAHWTTKGTFVSGNTKLKTIHDFGGFPDALTQYQYDVAGNPELAHKIEKVTNNQVQINNSWGIDHGAWSVLTQMYPDADVAVIQLSIDVNKTYQQHYDLAKLLADKLSSEDVLFITSGNVVHNLAKLDWRNSGSIYPWASLFNDITVQNILARDDMAILHKQDNFSLAHPYDDHYIPLVYFAGFASKLAHREVFNNKIDMAALAMTCFSAI